MVEGGRDAERERADRRRRGRAPRSRAEAAARRWTPPSPARFRARSPRRRKPRAGGSPSRTSPRSAPSRSRRPGAPPWTTASRSPRTGGAAKRRANAEPADGARKALFSYDDDESVADSPHATEALDPETQKRKPDRSLDSLPATSSRRRRARARWAAHQLAARVEGLASERARLSAALAEALHERDAVIAGGPPSARTSPRRSGARRTPSTSRRRRGRRRWRRGRRPRRRAS